ncbi:hypothetical protein [Nevskia soli]|uniref:hypothetical protein n=1 Tax=Nevskia soli TaxID=418856 RepID=UPI0004A6BD08|nr:hypothetical protein [Nevskia soli]
MDLQTNAPSEAIYQIHSAELCADHRLLLELLSRFEHDGSPESGRELMRVVVDLFRVHCAIESQALRTTVAELEWECEAMHERMEAIEAAASQGFLHLVGVVELKLALERFFAAKEVLMGPPQLLMVPATRSNRALLRDRNDLTAYAQHMVRLH